MRYMHCTYSGSREQREKLAGGVMFSGLEMFGLQKHTPFNSFTLNACICMTWGRVEGRVSGKLNCTYAQCYRKYDKRVCIAESIKVKHLHV